MSETFDIANETPKAEKGEEKPKKAKAAKMRMAIDELGRPSLNAFELALLKGRDGLKAEEIADKRGTLRGAVKLLGGTPVSCNGLKAPITFNEFLALRFMEDAARVPTPDKMRMIATLSGELKEGETKVVLSKVDEELEGIALGDDGEGKDPS